MKNLKFNTYLNDVLSINEPALNLILSQLCTQTSYRKNDIIYPRRKIPLFLSFIETGNAISLSRSKPNRQVLRFWSANQLICPYGFFNNTPANQSIIALDNCLLSTLSYRKLSTFLSDFPGAYKILNSILSAEIKLVELNIKSIDQNTSFQSHDAFLEALAISFEE